MEKEINGRIWDMVYEYVSANPGDIQTLVKRLWFNAYAENGEVFIESASAHAVSSRITVKRKLDKVNAGRVYELYKKGAKAKEFTDTTRNSSYWKAIFAQMGI